MMRPYFIAALAGVFLTAISQLLFKFGARHTHHRHPIFVYLNPFSICAYAMLLSVTILNTYAYKVLPLKIAVELIPMIYILIGIFSFTLLKERMTRNQLVGAAIIIGGIALFNIG